MRIVLSVLRGSRTPRDDVSASPRIGVRGPRLHLWPRDSNVCVAGCFAWLLAGARARAPAPTFTLSHSPSLARSVACVYM